MKRGISSINDRCLVSGLSSDNDELKDCMMPAPILHRGRHFIAKGLNPTSTRTIKALAQIEPKLLYNQKKLTDLKVNY